MARRSDKGELWITAQPTHQTWRIPQPSTSLASRCTVELYACIFTSHKMKPILCEETSVLRGHMAPIKYSCMSFIKLEISLPQILVNTSPGLLSTYSTSLPVTLRDSFHSLHRDMIAIAISCLRVWSVLYVSSYCSVVTIIRPPIPPRV